MLIAGFVIIFTIVIYVSMTWIYKQFPFPLFLPILTSTIVIIVILTVFHMSYSTFMIGGVWINHLLGPAVVALAYPLYKEWQLIKKHAVAILGGVLIGTMMAIIGVWYSANLLGINQHILFSLLPKSVTSPVAIDISKEIGGAPPLTVSFVMIAGIFGSIVGPYLFRWLRIHHYLGRGIGYGSASHAIGTTKALEEHSTTGAASSVAMILSAIFSSILIPVLLHL